MFGYMSYDAVENFEDINFQSRFDEDSIPQIHYTVYRNVIVVNHFKSELYIFNHQLLSLDFQQLALEFKKTVASNMGKPSFKVGIDYTIVGKGPDNLAGTDILLLPNISKTFRTENVHF